MTGQDSDLFAILGHCPAGDRKSALGKHGHDILVTERVPGILVANNLGDGLADAFVAHRLAVVRRVAESEKIFKLEEPSRRREVLPRNGPTDGSLVHADGLRDVTHCHRPKMGWTE